MKIEFCVYDKHAHETVRSIFKELTDVTVHQKSITDADYSSIISAGNSFAEMNGGVDGVVNLHLTTSNRYMQEVVKEHIGTLYVGELPVGQSILVPTSHPKHRQLIYTPTMRVAENVSNSINAYLAFRSALIIMKQNNILATSTPLFCTGVGGMSVEKACLQMKEAYLSVVNRSLIGQDWLQFHKHHRYLYSIQ